MPDDKSDSAKIILRKDVVFSTWTTALEAKLSEKKVLAHVFHDIPGLRPRTCPTLQSTEAECQELETWIMNDRIAKSIVLTRLDKTIRPEHTKNTTAKEVYDHVAETFQPSSSLPYIESLDKLLNTKFTSSADEYISAFNQNHSSLKNATALIHTNEALNAAYKLPDGMAAILFLKGTAGIDWLSTWRNTKAVKDEGYADLKTMMKTIREAAGQRKLEQGDSNSAIAASARGKLAGKTVGNRPQDLCNRCKRNSHTNQDCFTQHPEKAPENWKSRQSNDMTVAKSDDRKKQGKKDRAKKRAAAAAKKDDSSSDEDESEDDELYISSAAVCKSAASTKSDQLLWDTGSSLHFIKSKHLFTNLEKMAKPLEFDQAVGAASIKYQGTAIIKIGRNTLKLKGALYSPKSSCNIISAGRMERIAKLIRKNDLLIHNESGSPFARLAKKGDVYFVKPLHEHTTSSSHQQIVSAAAKEQLAIAGPAPTLKQQDIGTEALAKLHISAPAYARVDRTTSADLWHERLGHVKDPILKKTAANSIGLEGVDFSELSNCQTCHLSKAQRYVSREPRPTPNEPLDEIHVDMVGPLDAALFTACTYLVILTDARTRYRWAIMTTKKDHIAPQIRQWIILMEHQYGKRVRIIFRDGGSEFLTLKDYCYQFGIRTDVSAPSTPEQNGTAESANKTIVGKARAFLIGAGMPVWYWEWAVHHSCYITNRLYNLRTKKTPVTDFKAGLKQPYNHRVTLKNIPKFGCRAYKTMEPKPGKFQPRAEMGWFLGFQQNTSKNFAILHSHQTKTGPVWKVSYTPHASFDESITLGSVMSSIEKQNTAAYWISETPQTFGYFGQGYNQSTAGTEGEPSGHVASQNATHEQAAEKSMPAPSSPTEQQMPAVQQPPTVTPAQSEQTQQPPVVQPSRDERAPQEQHRSLIQEEEQTPPSPPQHTQMQLVPFSPADDQGESIQLDEEPELQTHRLENQQSQSMGIEELAHYYREPQSFVGRHRPKPMIGKRSRPLSVSENATSTPLGTKRDRSPNDDSETAAKRGRPDQIIQTRHGRNIVKHDYGILNSGRAATAMEKDPTTWSEAMSSQNSAEWLIAARDEFKTLLSTGAVKIIKRLDLPPGRNVLKGKFVFKTKLHSDGTLDKRRARFTAKGFTQRQGIDYKETFAPTPCADSVRILLALSHQLRWYRRQGDVKHAFLNPKLAIQQYMEMPEGFRQKGMIFKILRGLYGLKQSAFHWYDDFKATLKNNGFFPTVSDVCVYTNKEKDVFVLLHVDDFFVMGPHLAKIDNLMRALEKAYEIKVVNTDQFLGIKITEDKGRLKMDQGLYARALLTRHGLEKCKTTRYPLEQRLGASVNEPCHSRYTEYNKIVGGLQFLANQTRPDISHAVNHLARFLHNPGEEHLTAAKHVLRFIANEPDKGISFSCTSKVVTKPQLEAYSDADFAEDPDSSRSTSGMLIRLADGPVSWKSHLQKEVVHSSTEAEYLALTETCRQLQWVKSLLEELGLQERIKGSGRTPMYVDNQSAIRLATSHDNHRRSKHIALRNHYCKEQAANNRIKIEYVETGKQLADALTKPKSPVPIE